MLDRQFVLLRNDYSGQATVFSNPLDVIRINSSAELDAGFGRLETARRDGKWIAGYLAYEAGFSLDPALDCHDRTDLKTPLMCFGVFDAPGSEIDGLTQPPDLASYGDNIPLRDVRPGWNRQYYRGKFNTLHDHIARGDCYQGNLTFPIHAQCQIDARELFWRLTARQPVRYGALVCLDYPHIVSRSPELFFDLDASGWLETHPMKGTARRGANAEDDRTQIEQLRESTKNQAENRMIVDLLRNDLARISQTGTVTVPRLFEIETYPTLHQMISKVRGFLRPGLDVRDIFAALFPCGSITGAPKISAMNILRRLEDTPRGAYCGAIGYIGPGGQMRFNVAIRTITLHEDRQAVFNVGGGIVFDSDSDSEYDEALLKAKFVTGSNGFLLD